jgi:hypothetical protein
LARYFHEEFTDPLLIAINDYKHSGRPAAAALPSVAVTYSSKWIHRMTRMWLGGSIKDMEAYESSLTSGESEEALRYGDVPSSASPRNMQQV